MLADNTSLNYALPTRMLAGWQGESQWRIDISRLDKFVAGKMKVRAKEATFERSRANQTVSMPIQTRIDCPSIYHSLKLNSFLKRRV